MNHPLILTVVFVIAFFGFWGFLGLLAELGGIKDPKGGLSRIDFFVLIVLAGAITFITSLFI